MNKEILDSMKKDYIEIMNQDENWDVDNCYREAYVYGKLMDKYGTCLIKETNNLWFFLNDMQIAKYEEIFATKIDGYDKNKIASVYIDIENSSKVLCIPLEEQVKFEEENNIIRGKRSIRDYWDRYYNIRYEFFKLCIENNAAYAVKKLLEEEQIRIYEDIEETYLTRKIKKD